MRALMLLVLAGCTAQAQPLASHPASGLASGDAGFWNSQINTPTADTFDDFSDSDINTIWREWDVNADLTAAEDTNSLLLTKSQHASSWSGYTEELPTGQDYLVTLCGALRHGSGDTGDMGCGLLLGEDCSGDAANCSFHWTAMISGTDTYRFTRATYTDHDTWASTEQEHTQYMALSTFCVRWFWDESDSDMMAYASNHGRNWHALGVPDVLAAPVTANVEAGPIVLNTQSADGYCDLYVYRVDLSSDPHLEVGELR